ncbi:T9SS C-terminal target domain-containing protein [Flavobacterium arcticum]|uniref:T9SS C-terminal target domain-containing protein n=1 Tax=Flavobacterium arcticum TaxID=1784713 RepID=A0A345H8B0_9FLAO|nr:T9SS type A sorting domain-containing protein [Flavobacterium arcticum]AXG72820.1 T9SS C-terminal target domain-containing protein [Flavobacterium arcticum]KAF2510515.1 T9SS type A sorting domain-containing protein [Flavobacterium arcticum]
MKKNLLLFASLFTGLFTSAQEDYTAVTIPLQPAYTDQVFFQLSSNTQTAVAVDSWDLAFLRYSVQEIGIRINDSQGTQVFEASNDINDWATIDITEEANWTQLYNSETTWLTGAFDTGSAEYGWGNYNPANHHVTGAVVFVLKYTDGSYKKLVIEDYFGGYTIKYATWNSTAWGDDVTSVIPNGDSNYTFNFFSLDTDETVTVSPEDTDWDLAFGRYYGNIGTDEEPTMYLVSGALNNSATVLVAQIDETGVTEEEPTAPAGEAYSTDINTIGDDWKAFNMNTFTYDIDAETTYYVKHVDEGTIYRLYFTSFEGSSTGNLSFNYKNISATADLEDLNSNVSFGFYPNPTTDKRITLMYDLKNSVAEKNTVTIYSVTGAKVFETEVTSNSGFYTKEVNLSSLTSGIYIVQMQSGNYTESKKLVIR